MTNTLLINCPKAEFFASHLPIVPCQIHDMSEVWDSQSVKISLVCKYTLLKMWSCLVVLAVKENNRRIILTFESLWTFKRTKTIGYTFASKTTKTRKGAKRINSSISGAHTHKKNFCRWDARARSGVWCNDHVNAGSSSNRSAAAGAVPI